MKYMRRTAGYTWTDYKTNTQITKELKITSILDKLLEYKRNWIQHVNRMPRNRLPRVMKHNFPTGRMNYGRLSKRFLDMWDRNRSTSGLTPWQIYDDDGGSLLITEQFGTIMWTAWSHKIIDLCSVWQLTAHHTHQAPTDSVWKGCRYRLCRLQSELPMRGQENIRTHNYRPWGWRHGMTITYIGVGQTVWKGPHVEGCLTSLVPTCIF